MSWDGPTSWGSGPGSSRPAAQPGGLIATCTSTAPAPPPHGTAVFGFSRSPSR